MNIVVDTDMNAGLSWVMEVYESEISETDSSTNL